LSKIGKCIKIGVIDLLGDLFLKSREVLILNFKLVLVSLAHPLGDTKKAKTSSDGVGN
jgi:hypothetical protein